MTANPYGGPEPPALMTYPKDAVAWCWICGRFIKHGTPYRMLAPGRFAHAGPCRVIQGGKA